MVLSKLGMDLIARKRKITGQGMNPFTPCSFGNDVKLKKRRISTGHEIIPNLTETVQCSYCKIIENKKTRD